MATAGDIEKSFAFLHDNIPTWCNNLAEIQEKVLQMQNEMAKVPASISPPMKRKTGSIESIRDLDVILESPSASAAVQQSPFATRKRKPTSVLSGQASGPSKYRSRTMIIVYYDGQIQKSFETLVRSIGTGRNILRKGKMAARMEELSALAGSDDESEDDDDPIMSKIQYRHRAGLSSMRARPSMRLPTAIPVPTSSAELFDSIDKALEQAQALCERAAHQSLRDGECKRELDGMRKHFEEVLEKATKEVEKHKARKDNGVEKQAAKEEEYNLETAAQTTQATSTPPDTKPTVPTMRPLAAPLPTSKPMDIEIDSDSDDEMDFVMPPIRLTSRA